MAKDAYYFSHDSNARNDTKILSMRCDYGLEGYGMYWMIIEALRDESGYKLKLDKSTYRALAMQMHSKVDAVEKFIKDCIDEYNLFKSDESYFWAESLLRRMEKLESIRDKRRKAAQKRWESEENAKGMQMHSKSNAEEKQNYAKESKGKESKGNKYTEDFECFWNLYPRKEGKEGAFKHFKKALKDSTVEELIKSAKNYSEVNENTEKKFIKKGYNFFNDGVYKDYIDYEHAENKSNRPNGVKPPNMNNLGKREEIW